MTLAIMAEMAEIVIEASPIDLAVAALRTPLPHGTVRLSLAGSRWQATRSLGVKIVVEGT